MMVIFYLNMFVVVVVLHVYVITTKLIVNFEFSARLVTLGSPVLLSPWENHRIFMF